MLKGMTFPQFHRNVRGVFRKLDKAILRTTPVDNTAAADNILGFWTAAGLLAKRRIT